MIATRVLIATLVATGLKAQTPPPWPQHSLTRPQPRVVTPGPVTAPTPPPSDAVVLFDGRTLGEWRATDTAAGPARWRIVEGAMEVAPGTGAVATRKAFGDVQLHIEWMTPTPPQGEGQERGNSGVFFMGIYELQVLDSYGNTTYPDGQAAAIYGEFPPMVNASRPPGQWQTYDVVFHRPHFDASGKVTVPARMTVLHNGIIVQDNTVLLGPTHNQERAPYVAHADRLPLTLQDHGVRIRFRNIWIRELREGDGQ